MNQRCETGYKYRSDVYRPTVKVNEKTPTISKDLSEEQIDKAKRRKAKKGRVKQFDK